MDIILGEQQQEAISKIVEFIKSDDIDFSLSGYAGTGKSTIIKYLVEHFEENGIDYVLCAPTHQARGVLQYFSGREATTIHKLLSLSPNIEIFELDFRELLFHCRQKSLSNIPFEGVIICDESSMVNDPLYELLIKKCKDYEAKIVFVGDVAQLRPVKSKYNSLVFNTKNSYVLTKIYRQNTESGLVDILSTLRETSVSRFTESLGSEGSLYCYNTALNLFESAVPHFRNAISNGNIYEAKLLAYTNDRVKLLNNKMREILFPGEEQYYKTEILTCYENMEFNMFNFYNSMNYIIIEPPVKIDIPIPKFTKVPGFRLKLYDSSINASSYLSIIDKELPQIYWNSLISKIEELRIGAIEAKQRRDRKASFLWKDYFSIMGSFASPIDLYYDGRMVRKKSFDYGYAMTTHKSQGSSLNNVFIDMKDISRCRDKDELRQLQYVSVSRTKRDVHILQ